VANLLHATPVPRLNFTNKYVYDLAGNRLWKTNFSSAGTQVTGYTYNANDQLVTETNVAGSFTNKYDANGSVTNRSSATETNLYSYNLEGRLATATIRRTEGGNPVVQTNKYFYNSSGIRTRAEMTGSVNATNIFLNDPQNLTGFSQVLEELPSVGATPTASYTIGSQLISQKKSGTNLYFIKGSVQSICNNN
jgi:YD repeat-containing protein